MQKINSHRILHKPIKCPYCDRRLIDENSTSNTRVIVNPNNDCEADYYLKCPKCTIVIGIKKIK